MTIMGIDSLCWKELHVWRDAPFTLFVGRILFVAN